MAIVRTGRLEPPPQPHAAIRQMLREGRNNEAVARLKDILAAAPGDVPARELMFDAQFQRRNWAEALSELQVLLQARPDVLRYRVFEVSTLSNGKRYEDAAARARAYLAAHGENISVLNALKVSCFGLGRIDEAVRCGQRVLELHDAEAWRRSSGRRLSPSAGRAGKSIIAFSLWGRHAAYNYGALINLALAAKVYPGWTCRYYVGADVPGAIVDHLVKGGAEVLHPDAFPGVPMLYARFLPLDDPTVARFLSRDCDSRLNDAEAGLVAEWEKSGAPFHVIRDHVLHTEPIMGQLWGGRAGRLGRE